MVVLPTEPVMPTTRSPLPPGSSDGLAQPLQHDAREVAERLLDVRRRRRSAATRAARRRPRRAPRGRARAPPATATRRVVVAVDVLAGQRDEQAAGHVVARVDDDGPADHERRVGGRRRRAARRRSRPRSRPPSGRSRVLLLPAGRALRASTSRSLYRWNTPAISWVGSWPLPVMITVSCSSARARASRMACARLVASCTSTRSGRCARTPSRMAERMAAGSSERGFSSVTTITSASRAAISPMIGRLPWSRSPSEPNTSTSRPGRDGAHGLEREDERVGRVRVVDEREREAVAALDDALHAAGDLVRVGRPRRSRRRAARPAACASTIASAALETLTRPGSGLAAACSAPSGPRSVNVEPTPSSPMSAATTAQSASAPSAPDVRRDGLDRDRRLGGEPAAPLVVDDDDPAARLPGREQPRLVAEVALHVAVEVEVVALQVGEPDDVERRGRRPARARARARRPPWRRAVAPRSTRQREQRLQRRAPRPWCAGSRSPPRRSAARPCRARAVVGVRGAQRGVDEVGRRGLAVGAR